MMRGLAILVGALVAGCASASSFDRLEPIAAMQQAELRIRIAYYPSAAAGAYVVRPGEITAHDYDGVRWTARTVATERADRVLIATAQLADLDGAELSCGIIDGNVASIEALIDQRHFSLTASNPDLCQDTNSRRVNEVLQMIEEAVR